MWRSIPIRQGGMQLDGNLRLDLRTEYLNKWKDDHN